MPNLIQGRRLVILKTMSVHQDEFEYRVSSLSDAQIEHLKDPNLAGLYRCAYFVSKPVSYMEAMKFVDSARKQFEDENVLIVKFEKSIFLGLSSSCASSLIEDAIRRQSLGEPT